MSYDILVRDTVRQMRSDLQAEKKLIGYGYGSHQATRMLTKYMDILCDHDWQRKWDDIPGYYVCKHCGLHKVEDGQAY